MHSDVCHEIHSRERDQFIEEVRAGEDLVAYLPSESLPSDRRVALTAIHRTMFDQSGEALGLSNRLGLVATALEGFDLLDAFVVTDRLDRSSVWVASDFKRYKRAYQRFWRVKLGLSIDPIIPGNVWHVDHAFNRARIHSTLSNRNRREHGDGSAAIASEQKSAAGKPVQAMNSLGYVRLFLVSASVNRAWGRSVERIRAIAGEEHVTAHPASYMIMAKLIGALPPVTPEDIQSLAARMMEVFELVDVVVDDLYYLVGHDTRRIRGGLRATVSADGVLLTARSGSGELVYRSERAGLKRTIADIEDLVSYACETGCGLDRPFTPGEANAARYLLREDSSAVFVAFVHHLMRWPVVRFGEPGCAWYGIVTPDGTFADAEGVHSKDELISHYDLPPHSQIEFGGWELLDSVLWIARRPYAPFGYFWMCWKALPCLPDNPFKPVLDAWPSADLFYERGLCDDDGEIIGW